MKFRLDMLRSALVASVLAWGAAHTAAQELKVGLSSNPQSADPHFFNNDAISAMMSHAYETLIKLDADGKLVPGLAVSWRAVNDNTWEFKLRPGVKFHDGSPLTADDVAFSLDRPATISNSPSSFTTYTKSITSKRIIDPLTILLTTAAPAPLLPNDLTQCCSFRGPSVSFSPGFSVQRIHEGGAPRPQGFTRENDLNEQYCDLTRIFVVSKKAAEKASTDDFNQSKVDAGTGPFSLVKFTRGDGARFTRFGGYWGPKPAWSEVHLRFLPTDSARMSALLSGDVQLIENVQANLVSQFKGNPELSVFSAVSTRVLFLFTDHRDSSPAATDAEGRPLEVNPLKDVRVRQAISKLIDRKVLTDKVLDKLGVPTGNLAAPGMFGFDDKLPPEPLDVAGAKKLLADAGYPNGFHLILSGPNDRYVNDEQVLQAIGQMLSQGGLKMKVNVGPMSTYVGRASRKELGFSLLGWGVGGGEPSSPLRGLLATTDKEKGMGANNWGSYSNPAYDKMIAEALSTVDDKKRENLFRDAVELALKKDQALIPLYNQVSTWATRKGISYTPRADEATLAYQAKPQ